METFGKHAVVCGRSKNVGMPIAMLLHADGLGKYKQMYLLIETDFIMFTCEFCCVYGSDMMVIVKNEYCTQ